MKSIITVCGILLLLTALVGSCSDGGSGGGIGAPAYTVTYDGNHPDISIETVPVDSNLYAERQSVAVLGHGQMTLADHGFAAWNTLANASGTTHLPGSTFTMGRSDVVLYAQWSSSIANVDIRVVDDAGEIDVAAADNAEPADVGVIEDIGTADVTAGDDEEDVVVDACDGSGDVDVGVGEDGEDVEIILDDDTGDVEIGAGN